MSGPDASMRQQWLERGRRLPERLRRLTPFISGAVAALLILVLYNTVKSDPDVLDVDDVAVTVAEALA